MTDPLSLSRRLYSDFDSLLTVVENESRRCKALECSLLEIRCLLDLPAEGYRHEWNQAVLSRIRSILSNLEASRQLDPPPGC
jgi:hypothetical protein